MDKLLKQLTQTPGASGNEDEVRELIMSEIRSKADEISVDRMGNLIVLKKGKKHHKKMMLCAHMDEVGFIITDISDNGMLKFKPVGGMDPRVLVSKKVRIGKKRWPGVLGIKAIHLQEPEERNIAVKIKQMYIDIGASSKAEAEKCVKRGDFAVFDSSYMEFGDGKIKAKALDDRVGCDILVKILEKRYDYDLYVCFTVQEEVGLRGAEVLAYNVQPDAALVVEATTCADIPEVEEHLHTTIMGKGPAVTIIDRTSYADKNMVELLVNSARDNNIPVQLKSNPVGGNDAGKIHVSREGIPCATVSVPCRYIHSPASVMDINDYKNTSRLVEEFLKGMERMWQK